MNTDNYYAIAKIVLPAIDIDVETFQTTNYESEDYDYALLF